MPTQIHDHPPPSYLDQDTDLVSLRSVAPSYTSSIPPTYTPRTPRTYASLIPPSANANSVPGPIPTHHTYNVASWPSLSNQSQSRAYLNVAARRARRAQEQAQEQDVRRALRLVEEDNSGGGSIPAARGEAFDEALRTESKAWDFFTAQISDWDQREMSWKAFKAKHHTVFDKKGKGKGKLKVKWGFYGRLG